MASRQDFSKTAYESRLKISWLSKQSIYFPKNFIDFSKHASDNFAEKLLQEQLWISYRNVSTNFTINLYRNPSSSLLKSPSKIAWEIYLKFLQEHLQGCTSNNTIKSFTWISSSKFTTLLPWFSQRFARNDYMASLIDRKKNFYSFLLISTISTMALSNNFAGNTGSIKNLPGAPLKISKRGLPSKWVSWRYAFFRNVLHKLCKKCYRL